MLKLSRLLPMLVAATAVGCVYPDLKMGTSSGGAGGATSMGGVMASGGDYGATGGTSTVGNTATGGRVALGGAYGSGTGGGTSTLCSGQIPPTATGSLTVTSGYVTIGTLHGYAWSWVGDKANATTCITPTCNPSSCTPQFAGTALCVAGDVTADSSGNSIAGVEFNVNQASTTGAAAGAITIANSITLTDVVSGASGYLGNSSLRAYMDDASGNHYCVESGAWTSGKPIPISSFNTQCWKPTSSAVYASATTQITGIGLVVPSSTTVGRPFAFCLTNITVNICAPSPGGKSCANAGDLYCSGTVCCGSSIPYYCPATSYCYPTAEKAAADCGSMACSGCGSN